MTNMATSSSLRKRSPLDALVRQPSLPANLHSPRLQPNNNSFAGNYAQDPASPLLHTHFRASVSTAVSTEASFIEGDAMATQSPRWNRDDGSVYSTMTDAPGGSGTSPPNTHPPPISPISSYSSHHSRQSWSSQGSDETVQFKPSRRSADNGRDTWRSSDMGADPFNFRSYESPRVAVPTVVISSPTSSFKDFAVHPPQSSRSPSMSAARPSLTQYNVTNFSRPTRSFLAHDDGHNHNVTDSQTNWAQANPPVNPFKNRQPADGSLRRDSPSQQLNRLHPSSHNAHMRGESVTGGSKSNAYTTSRSSEDNYTQESTPGSLSSQNANVPLNTSVDVAANSPPTHVRLPTKPPSPRPTSRASLYSTYSFYQLPDGSRTPSPDTPTFPTAQENSDPRSKNDNGRISPYTAQSHDAATPEKVPSSKSHTTAEEYLSLGIQFHEDNKLADSAACFERSATVDGGCGVGMLMWGLSLRHAWGTVKDEKAAFLWLRRAAEAAMDDLEVAPEGTQKNATQRELVLAIYEVGQCFFQGWGVAQDRKMAVSYFQVAARLGDIDAQQELGYCLANGKGCKKNLKEAAKWYRAAAAQGASTVGLAWIYKPKYS